MSTKQRLTERQKMQKCMNLDKCLKFRLNAVLMCGCDKGVMTCWA